MASRRGSALPRLLLACAAAGGAYLLWLSTLGSPAPVDLLPAGAAVVVEAHDAAGVVRRVSGTRFATAFAKSDTRAWIERTELVSAYDALIAEISRVTGISPGRGIAFDFVGSDAAAAWYPPLGAAPPAPWIAGGRLSLRAWATSAALRLVRGVGIGSTLVTRDTVAGRAIYSFPADAGASLHLFFAGRVLVASADRSLVLKAARAADDPGAGVAREPALQAIRSALPGSGELFVWLRDRSLLLPPPAAGAAGRSIGALLHAGKTVEIDIAADPFSPPSGGAVPDQSTEPLPAIALLRGEPLFFLSSRAGIPPPLLDLLRTRQRAVAARTGSASLPAAIAPGTGFALALTGTATGSGLLPSPQGFVVIGMASAGAAREALPLLYPPGARTAAAGGARALATRESVPLAGDFDLWGAAIGPRLIFATDTALIDALAKDADAAPTADSRQGDPAWRVAAVAAISLEKAQPLLRSWSAPLSGLFSARWPRGPEIASDVALIAAVRTVRATVGSDGRRDRAAITVNLRDLP